MSDDYEQVARGKLKLKTDSNKISKKKKKDKKNREKLELEHGNHQQAEALNGIQSAAPRRTMTKAELSFKKMQEKMVCAALCNQNSYQIISSFVFLCAYLSFASSFSCSKRNESWKRHHKRINNASRNSMNI